MSFCNQIYRTNTGDNKKLYGYFIFHLGALKPAIYLLLWHSMTMKRQREEMFIKYDWTGSKTKWCFNAWYWHKHRCWNSKLSKHPNSERKWNKPTFINENTMENPDLYFIPKAYIWAVNIRNISINVTYLWHHDSLRNLHGLKICRITIGVI